MWYTQKYIPVFPEKREMVLISNKALALSSDAFDFAKKLTLIDHLLYRQIKAESYLNVLTGNIKQMGGSHNVGLQLILNYVQWFRILSLYTSCSILMEDGAKKKSSAIKQWLKIAKVGLSITI